MFLRVSFYVSFFLGVINNNDIELYFLILRSFYFIGKFDCTFVNEFEVGYKVINFFRWKMKSIFFKGYRIIRY